MFKPLMTFDVVSRKDLSQEIIFKAIAGLRNFDNTVIRENAEVLLDFYEGRQNKPEYLKNFGFKDIDMPLMTFRLTKKIIDKISLLYKYAPERSMQKENTYNDFINDFDEFNVSLKTAERYKNLLHSVLYMPTFSKDGFSPRIFTEWIPYFVRGDVFKPVAYSIPLYSDTTNTKDQSEEEWLFVSETEWFIHNGNGGNRRPDETFEKAADMSNPLGMIPFVELRENYPVTGYWPDGEIELVQANMSLNIALNDLISLIHFEAFPERVMTGVTPEEVGKVRNIKTGLWEGGNIKTGPGITHTISDPQANMSVLNKSAAFDSITNTIQKILQFVSTTYGVNMKFEISGTAPSGFSLMVENIDLMEDREDSIDMARMAENDIYKIISKQNEIYKLGYNLPELTKDNKLTVDFSDGINFPVNYQEEIDRWKYELEIGAKSIVDYMRSQGADSELEDEEIIEKINKNKAINRNMTRGEQAFNDILNGLNEPGQDTQQ